MQTSTRDSWHEWHEQWTQIHKPETDILRCALCRKLRCFNTWNKYDFDWNTSCLFLQASVQTYNKYIEAQTISSEMPCKCNNNFTLWIFPIGSNQTWWGLRSGLSLERIVIGAAICDHHGRSRFSGGCFLRSPRWLRLRRCHSQEGSKESTLSETFYTKLCQPPLGSRRSPPSWLLSCARAPQSQGRGPEKRWPIRSLHFNYRPMRTHHQPVGEVCPHDGPAVASLVGVILLDVVRILICGVQDNNLLLEWLGSLILS